MAVLTDNKDGTVTIALDQVERDTFVALPTGQFEAYLTLWLKERATQTFQDQFNKLSPQDKADVLSKFRNAGK